MLPSLVYKGQGFFEEGWLYSLGSIEEVTSGYQGPVVTVFLNRVFSPFSAPGKENSGDKSSGVFGPSPAYLGKPLGHLLPGTVYIMTGLSVSHSPFGRFTSFMSSLGP